MSKAEMRETCGAVSEDHAVINQYCKITGKGEISKLKAVIVGGFGHCDRTAQERIKQLIESNVIISYGKFWKYNDNGNTEFQSALKLLKSLRDSGIPESKEAPQSADDIVLQNDMDKANREKYRAPQE
jgi:hypothetical protein